MPTSIGMIIRNDRQNEYWPHEIYWPVIARHTSPGWRSGRTRVYTLKCGHTNRVPFARQEGRGKTAYCNSCTCLWHWITTDSGGVDPRFSLKDIRSGIVEHMLNQARQMGILVRTINQKEVSA